MKHWVLIANATAGRIFETDETFSSFSPVLTRTNGHVHPETGELGPRGATRSGPGGERSAFDRHTDPADAERARFSRELAAEVDGGLVRGAYERLVIAAPPKLLGELRAHLSRQTLHHLVASVSHDFAHTPEHELPEAVRKLLPETAGLEG